MFRGRARFYAVLDRDDEPLARTLAAHADVLQVRIKPAVADEIAARRADGARASATSAGVAARSSTTASTSRSPSGADGVHLGQTDLPLAEARAARAATGSRSASRRTTLAQMQRARGAARPDYVAYGPVFATRTKQNPDPVQGIEALRAGGRGGR